MAYDYNKHYTTCFMGQDVKYGWPIYNVFDEVEIFCVLSAGFYHVKTSNFFPFRGNGFYDADLVDSHPRRLGCWRSPPSTLDHSVLHR